MTVTRISGKVLGLLILCFALVGSAQALNTHLNITVQETVHQNVTYAADFDLVENRTYSLIEGVITIRNPGSETVYDANIRLDNVENLASNFTQVSGRSAYQSIYPDVTGSSTTLSGVINSTWQDIGYDLDEDGTNDLYRVNDTHILFNLTSEWALHTVAFYNSTNSTLDITAPPTTLGMDFNLTSLRDDGEYNEGIVFASIQMSGTNSANGYLNLTDVTFALNDTARPYAILHIPELRSGQQTVYNYNISSLLVDPPLDISTEYTNDEYKTKVLAGEYFWVQLTAANIATVGALETVNITLQAADVNVSNGTQWEMFNFTLHNLSTNVSISEDNANVYELDNRTWYWGVNGGTIPVGEAYNISFQVRAPDTVSSSGSHLALTQTLEYQISTTASTLSVYDVRARASVDFNTTKRIVSPQDNASNRNVTWASTPKVGTSENITFTLEKVTLWVTTTLDPNQDAGLSQDYADLDYDINMSTRWQGSNWLFNFTDGSHASAPPPIIWVKPYWIIKNTGNQIINSSITVNGTDLYMNYIYVVNGYWLEVQKQVLDAGDDQYDIYTVVKNRGNGYTPQNLTVTVYDFIPQEFTAFDFLPNFDADQDVTGEFSGKAYQWDVGLRTNLSTSFSPKGSADGLDVFEMNYSVNGSGDFRVSDLYIVGLDPRLVDGANSYTGVSVISAIATNKREVIYLAIVAFLIAINVANFLMTSKISKKLDR